VHHRDIMSFKNPAETFAAVEAAGIKKSKIVYHKLIMQGFCAGAYIGVGGLFAVMVGGGVPAMKATDAQGTALPMVGVQKLLFGGVFPVGLMATIFTGAELFTGNCMCLVAPLVTGKIKLSGLLYNWILSYLGNFIGSVAMAACLAYYTGLMEADPWNSVIKAIADGKCDPDNHTWGRLFWRGVGCNWLVCLAVWQAIAATDIGSKIWAIWWPIAAFVAIGFEHCVANMFFIPSGIFYGAETANWGNFLYWNLPAVTLGNIVGGGLFIGMYYAYVFGDGMFPQLRKKKAAKEEDAQEPEEMEEVVLEPAAEEEVTEEPAQ